MILGKSQKNKLDNNWPKIYGVLPSREMRNFIMRVRNINDNITKWKSLRIVYSTQSPSKRNYNLFYYTVTKSLEIWIYKFFLNRSIVVL